MVGKGENFSKELPTQSAFFSRTRSRRLLNQKAQVTLKWNMKELFVYSIGSSCVEANKQFYEVVEVEVCFQLDSGVKGNVMSMSSYQNRKHRLLKALKTKNSVLISFSKHKLKPCGEVVLQARFKETVAEVKFFVVEPDVESVLRGNFCVKLDLLKRSHQLTSNESLVRRVELDDYPELFNGLGCLPGTYHIELSVDAIPVVHSPRKIPVPQGTH